MRQRLLVVRLLKDLPEDIADRLEEDAAIHAAIVTGAGRAFVAGADIEEISGLDVHVLRPSIRAAVRSKV